MFEPKRACTPGSVGVVECLSSARLVIKRSKDYLSDVGGRVGGRVRCCVQVKDKFDKFSKRIGEIERLIAERNMDKSLQNRFGNVEVAYELLSPFSDQGMTAKGVPTGITI